jgi:hypothetical protein
VSVTLSGTLASGDQFRPETESVQVTLDGITQSAALGAGGEFSTTLDTSSLGAAGSPYAIGYSYAGDGTYASASDSGALTVSRATPMVRAIDVGGAYDGSAFSAIATITGMVGSPASELEGVSSAFIYFAGSTEACPIPLPRDPSQVRHLSQDDAAVCNSSAHVAPVSPTRLQCGAQRGPAQTHEKSLKSTSIEHQPNVRQMADAPDSKSAPRKRVWFKSSLRDTIRLDTLSARRPRLADAPDRADDCENSPV